MEDHFLSKFYNRNKFILPTYVTTNSKKNDDINDAEIYVQNMDSLIRLFQFLLLTLFIVFFYMWLQNNGMIENNYPEHHKVFQEREFHNYLKHIKYFIPSKKYTNTIQDV